MSKKTKTYEEIKASLLDVIIAVDNNANAYDDDLEETFDNLVSGWKKLKEDMDKYLYVGRHE